MSQTAKRRGNVLGAASMLAVNTKCAPIFHEKEGFSAASHRMLSKALRCAAPASPRAPARAHVPQHVNHTCSPGSDPVLLEKHIQVLERLGRD